MLTCFKAQEVQIQNVKDISTPLLKAILTQSVNTIRNNTILYNLNILYAP